MQNRNSKLIFSALGLFFPGTGLNCFYLLGMRSLWGVAHLITLIGGLAGWWLLHYYAMSSAAGWVLLLLGFISLEASWLTTIVFGLRKDELWDAQFNPHIQLNSQSELATKSGWLTVLCVIFSLIIGAGVMMTFFAITFEQFFISQLEAAKQLSQ